MKAAELRRSILQAAVEGKLVPQDPREEPASKLLERIREEKERLVKEGKTKKTKPLPPITEDEIPYELPEGWCWCRVGSIHNLFRGITFPGTVKSVSSFQSGIRCATTGSVQKEYNSYADVFVPEQYVKRDYQWLSDYDILVSAANSKELVGKSCFWFGNTKMTFGGFLTVIRPQISNIKYSYYVVQFFYRSGIFSSHAKQTTNIANLSNQAISNILFPLPPLAEQQRIVDKLDVLMLQCDELELAEKELEGLDGRFAESLPKSILQSAVEGKLVPQDPREEPASKLLERIRGEKEWLVQEGKIKKTKPLPPIAEDEIPYELPEGWCWCRLGDVGKIIGGATPDSHNETYYTASGNGITWITPADMKYAKNNIIEYGAKDITQVGYNSCSTQMLPKGSVVFSSRAPIGHIAFAGKELCTNQGFKSIVPYGFSNNYWLFYVLKSKIPDIQSRASGTTFKEVSGQFMEKELDVV